MRDGIGNSAIKAFAPVLIVGMLVLAIAQAIAGFVGIQHHLGITVAVIALLLAIFARFTLPLTVGAFFGAMNVWGWHWYWALAFTMPGLVFIALMIPGTLAASFAWGRRN